MVGHSTGGHAALELAGRHPGLAAGVVLLDIGPLAWTTDQATQNRGLASLLEGPAGPAVLRSVAEHLLPEDEPFAGREALLAGVGSSSPEAFAELIASDLEWDGAAAAAACPADTPVLLVVADEPLLDPVDFAARCPHALLGRTVGSGHFHQLVVPDQVIAMIERFLALLPSRAADR